MPPVFQQAHGIRTNTLLSTDLIGPKLAVDARRSHGCCKVEAMHQAIEQHLQHCGDDPTPSRAAGGQQR